MRSVVELFPATAILLLGAAVFVDHFVGSAAGLSQAVPVVLGMLIGLAVALALLNLVVFWATSPDAAHDHGRH